MLTDLRDGRAGDALLKGDAGWDDDPPFYASPGQLAVRVQPRTPEEVAAALRFAAAEGLGVAIRSGGHGGRLFANDGGMVIELQHFAGVSVDGSTVRVGGGAIWGDVATALAPHGLALSSGDTRTVGVGGLTLGGGVGWMIRQYGLAIDSLRSAQVVLPSGEIVTASADENPDLFWALRGGGGNFGVVTEFTFEAHPLDGVVFGTLTFSPDDLSAVLTGWRDVLRDAPRDLNSTVLAMPAMGPEMPAGLSVIACWAGRDAAAAEPWLERLRAVPGYLSDDVAAMDYVDALEEGTHFDGPMPTIVGANGLVPDLSDETIAAMVAAHADLGGVLQLRYVRGAMNEVPADATAWAHRDGEGFVMAAAFLPPGADRTAMDAARAKWAPAAAYTEGTYGNFADDVGDATVELMYPQATLSRLRELKRRYDPQNLLSRNQNIRP